MRRLRLWVTAVALASATSAIAQQQEVRTNTKELGRFAAAAAKDYKANRTKALKLAKKHGWVVEKTFPDGRHVSLQGLDTNGLPIYFITDNNARAAATVGTDQVWAGGALGLTLSGAGSNVKDKLAIWDGGRVRGSHQELTGRIVQKDTPAEASDHATHVAGTMVASGVNLLAKGMAYAAKSLLAYDFNSDVSEMAAAAPNLLVSNHSYGSISGWRYNSTRKGTPVDPYWEWWGYQAVSATEDYKFGYYDNSAAQWDKIAFEAPYYLMVKSSGNNRGETGPRDGESYYRRTNSGTFELVSMRENISSNNGYDIISTYGNAKNILTVGAVDAISDGYMQSSDVKISTFSSWGPTDDGRIKPDIVGNGVDLLSSISTSDNAYATYSGTSMAAPNVSGSLLLLQEHYANVMNGNKMRSATLKALVIHTADEAGTNPGPDYIFGWGILNMGRAAAVISDFKSMAKPVYKHLLEERQLQQGDMYTFDVVASGAGPLVVTIAWTDPEATPLAVNTNVLNNRTPRLINDLDLRILHKNTTYKPWVLTPESPASAATTGDNKLDNVEQVFIANAVPGETYKIQIAHKGTLVRGPQAYSIVASGVGGAAYCASAPTSDQGATIETIAIDGVTISPSRSAGCTTYSDFTETLFALEAGQTKTISLTPGTCTANAAKMAKVFIDWNGNGSFEDTGELVATSGVVTDNTTISASIAVPATVATGNKVRMRVVLSETTEASTISPCGSYAKGETQDYLVQLNKPGKDVATLSVAPATQAVCANPAQAIQVKIRNNGMLPQSNIPVKVTVRKNGAELTQLTGVYKGTINPSRVGEVTLTSFATEAGATYELTGLATLQGDVQTSNNEASFSFSVGNPEAAPQASVFRCGNDPNFSLTGTGNGTIYWYNAATDANPVAAGNQLLYPVSKVGATMFAALNDFSSTVGYKTKNDLSKGGYNAFDPDVYVKASAPMMLETARLYIGHSGKITFTVFNQDNAAVSVKTLNVTATRTTEAAGPVENDPADQGEVYYLGLVLPAAGDYRIAIDYEDGATIYRNNESAVPYPMGIPNVFQITGNSATTNTNTYYYYFYDLKVKALGCPSNRVQVQIKGATPLTQPIVTREGHKLHSSAAEGNQWYRNGTAIVGATAQVLEPTESGVYTVEVQKDGCLSEKAVNYNFVHKAGKTILGKEFIVYPNPSADGLFTLEGELELKDVVTFAVHDMLGNTLRTGEISNYNGQYEAQVNLAGVASGIYMVRIQKNDEVIVKRIVIQR
ncbi:S8 family serine peptidase [Pontibacter fetidus]|uniref:S8 family serine peptidase n=1 Tax=Pontibacter fetidus TaxID=2700082 RepID=A0A6B2HA62_9BACT|nr:S8 family serine peptidase [Pontibacter fetidus]NDK56492.1 S8 family serine peptidase [Pontibacter fetidus]